MANLRIITNEGTDSFAKKSWKRSSDYFFTAEDMLCPLGPSELPNAVMGMPIAFVCSDGKYSISAVQGLEAATNFFLSAEGKWLGNYVPAAYRGYPFYLNENPYDRDETLITIDADSGLLFDGDTEEPFFGEDLNLSPSVREIAGFLSKVAAAKLASIKICESLSEHGLLKPWELRFENFRVDGLFCIDEAALNELSDDAFAELRAAGVIPVIYCQLLSMQRISDLALFAQKKLEGDSQAQHGELNFNLGSQDGNVSFDNF